MMVVHTKKKSSKSSKAAKKSKKHTTMNVASTESLMTAPTKTQTSSKKTLALADEREIAMDFATKIYKEFDTLVKSIVLFGSAAKQQLGTGSDIDIIIIIDDVSIKFDEELIAWYRTHLGRLVNANEYVRPLHINSVKLSTWWQDVMRGDPIVINVLRYGEPLIDFGGFFNPLRVLLKEGKIHATAESIYTLLERSPTHLARARRATLAAVDGLYWSMVDAAHAALIASDVVPPSPEKIGECLSEYFVKNRLLHKKYVEYYETLHHIAKEIVHGKRSEISGKHLDEWFLHADEFLREMAKLVEDIIKEKKK